MAFAIPCPRCQVRLKSSKAPRAGKLVTCPQCGLQFLPERIDGPSAASPSSLPLPWILGGAAGLVVLLALGIGIALWMTRSNPDKVDLATIKTEEDPKADSKLPAKKEEPKAEEKKEEKKSDPGAEKKSDEAEKQKQDYGRLMIEGGIASGLKNHEEALTAYSAALKLFPKDAEATKKFDETRTAVDALVKAKQANEKSQQELDALITKAQQSLEGKQYAAATDLFKLALERSPSDDRALKGFTAAREELAKTQDDAKKSNEFKALLDSGRAALRQNRYADAIRDFTAAARLDPVNPLPGQLQQDAEKALDNLRNEKERKIEFQRLVDQATTATKAMRYTDAEQAYKQALKLFPNDKLVSSSLDDLRRMAKLARSDFDTHMVRGNLAIRDGRYRDAADAFREALRVSPGSEVAAKAARDADRLTENVSIYMQAMNRATTAMSLKRWLDAAQAYQDALRANPGDAAASQGLADAQAAIEADLAKRRAFEKHANAGVQLLKSQRYADAAQEFETAVKAYPTHPQADAASKSGRYAGAMGKATSAMQTMRYQEAVRFFQTALTEMPNDFAAQAGLQRARTLAASGGPKKL